MICIHHNKDLDGFTSGAIIKYIYPEAQLIGWDYNDPIPEIPNDTHIVMVDISFPLHIMSDLQQISRTFDWIDHHIGIRKEWESKIEDNPYLRAINYVFDNTKSACELAWEHYLPGIPLPEAIKLIGSYDIWRNHGTYEWKEKILPFQMLMRIKCFSAESFPISLFSKNANDIIEKWIPVGKEVIKYQEVQDMLNCKKSAFEKVSFDGMNAICLNQGFISSDTFKSVYDPLKHQVMVGFQFNGKSWTVSLRTTQDGVDVSAIAKSRGGGGHRQAAGFDAKTFEDIFI